MKISLKKKSSGYIKNKIIRLAVSAQRFAARYRKGVGMSKGYNHSDTSMRPSLPRLKRASGLMSKHRRLHQKAINNENGINMFSDLTPAQQIIQY
jgi:hypothetical protein